ncbi:Fic family protein [Patescibacteria group bacterium AH-259-L07]|nr:Fic family protein [Patescibacteria group bacterium AH-259-L07]
MKTLLILLFVTIHPYPDGNGRTARLFMNYVLLCSGYSWITITVEERIKYFKALEQGQVKNNIIPFADMIIKKLEKKKP